MAERLRPFLGEDAFGDADARGIEQPVHGAERANRHIHGALHIRLIGYVGPGEPDGAAVPRHLRRARFLVHVEDDGASARRHHHVDGGTAEPRRSTGDKNRPPF